jgi:hypothetical protein
MTDPFPLIAAATLPATEVRRVQNASAENPARQFSSLASFTGGQWPVGGPPCVPRELPYISHPGNLDNTGHKVTRSPRTSSSTYRCGSTATTWRSYRLHAWQQIPIVELGMR